MARASICPARRDRMGNNYPSLSECEPITQCLIIISIRARSRGYGAPRHRSYREFPLSRSALDAPTDGDDPIFSILGALLAPPRPLDFALDKFIPRLYTRARRSKATRARGDEKRMRRNRDAKFDIKSFQLRIFEVTCIRARNEWLIAA